MIFFKVAKLKFVKEKRTCYLLLEDLPSNNAYAFNFRFYVLHREHSLLQLFINLLTFSSLMTYIYVLPHR